MSRRPLVGCVALLAFSRLAPVRAEAPEPPAPDVIFAVNCEPARPSATVWPVAQGSFHRPPIDDAGTILTVFDAGKELTLMDAGRPSGSLKILDVAESMDSGEAVVLTSIPCEGYRLARSRSVTVAKALEVDWFDALSVVGPAARGSVMKRSPNWEAPAVDRTAAFPSAESGVPGFVAFWYSQAVHVAGTHVVTQAVAVASQAAAKKSAPDLVIENDTRSSKSWLHLVGFLDFDGDGRPELVTRWEPQEDSRCAMDGFRVYSKATGQWQVAYDGIYQPSGCDK